MHGKICIGGVPAARLRLLRGSVQLSNPWQRCGSDAVLRKKGDLRDYSNSNSDLFKVAVS